MRKRLQTGIGANPCGTSIKSPVIAATNPRERTERQHMVSIRDIARLVGMSPSTVSRVVNGKKYVKPEIREKVLAVVKETGYVPNHAARSMVLKTAFTVGIVIPDTFNMFQRELFSTIERRLEDLGYHSMFFFAKSDQESELACLRRLKSEKLDGIIVVQEIMSQKFYDYLVESALPVILCTFARPDPAFVSVHIDEEKASREATEHLIGRGHRRIGLIKGSPFTFGRLRERGFLSALEKHGIEVLPGAIVTVPAYTAESGKGGMQTLLARALGLTAVFALTDDLAIGAMRAVHEAGLSVPDSVSIVGFDDIDICSYLTPGLTTIRQPILDMGKRIAETMYGMIHGENPTDRSIVFPHELVIRESTCSIA